jgi:hypothetical protein
MGMRHVVTRLELAAAAAATVVMVPCGRTVVAGVAALPCDMVVVVVAVHVVSSEKKLVLYHFVQFGSHASRRCLHVTFDPGFNFFSIYLNFFL